MNEKKTYETSLVIERAKGNWDSIFHALVPELAPAIDRKGRHVTCPFHGGKNDFRIDRKSNEGKCFCSCKTFRSGFDVIMESKGLPFIDSVNLVGDFLGLEPYQSKKQRNPITKIQQVKPKQELASEQPIVESAAIPFDETSTTKDEAMDVSVVPPTVTPTESDQTAQTPSETSLNSSRVEAREAMQSLKKFGRKVKESSAQVVAPDESDSAFESPKPNFSTPVTKEEKRSAYLYSVMLKEFNDGIPLSDTSAFPAVNYLRKRGISMRLLRTLEDVRFNPSVRYYYDPDNEKVPDELKDKDRPFTEMPAIVAAIRNPDGRIVNLKRIFVTPRSGKKANVLNPKKNWSAIPGCEVRGGACRLGNPTEGILGVAEGLETALSAYLAWGIPCWSTDSAYDLTMFRAPENVNLVIVWVDNDFSKTGHESALKLEQRLNEQGIAVMKMYPPMPVTKRLKSVDWNDVLLKYGLFGFPYRQSLLKHFVSDSSMKIQRASA